MTARPILTEDQRWLLRAVGGWIMLDALIGPPGVARLMKSMYGSSGRPIDGGPAWLARGFQCGGGKVVSGSGCAPTVKVTTAQIKAYSRQLGAELLAEMKACQAATNANAVMRGRFCHCGSDPCGYGYYRDRICPPTEQQEADALAESWRCRDWTDDLLDRALGFERAEEPEPAGQLELFAIGAMSA